MRAAMDAPQKILLFAGSDSVSQGLASRLTALGHSVEVATEDTWPEPGMQIDQVVYARALSATDGPASIAAFLEAAARASRRLDKSSTLFVLTRFAFDIVGTEVLSANSAALSVAALVFAQEHPELNLCCCDLASDEADAEMVVRVMLSRLKNTVWLGVRGRTVWRPNVEPISQPLVEPQTHVATQEACILVGGSGRFGRWVGQWLAQSGCRDLTLVGRSGAMSKPLSVAIAAMREAGARVAVVQADVTDRNAMFRILQDVRASSGKNMTIFHLAGEPHAASAHAPVADLLGGDLRAALEEQWGAKVKGAEILLDWMRLHSGVRCVMFSSNASVLGGPGLAAYAAANAAMDAMALSAREREGLDCSSLSWDGWRLADDEQRSERSALEGFALHGKEPWDALLKAMSSGYGHLAVAKGNLAERHHKWVEELPGMGEEPTSAASLTNGAGSQKDDLVIVVRRVWSEVLGIEADDHADLFQVGGDSLTAMRIRTWIERIFGARLTLREVLQNRTIAGLAALVRRQLDAELGITKADEKATDFQNDDRTIRGRL